MGGGFTGFQAIVGWIVRVGLKARLTLFQGPNQGQDFIIAGQRRPSFREIGRGLGMCFLLIWCIMTSPENAGRRACRRPVRHELNTALALGWW